MVILDEPSVGEATDERGPAVIRELHPEQAEEMRRVFAEIIERNAPDLKPDQASNLARVLVGLASVDVPRMVDELRKNVHAERSVERRGEQDHGEGPEAYQGRNTGPFIHYEV
jgi:hypothetical protein